MSVIKIENLWKEYRLGVIGHGTLTHDLQSWWAKVRGKEDPNSKIPLLRGQQNQIEGDRFLALRNINLEIEEGEILGIIGKNGAGKSTLLKVLSRVTAPSKGSIKVKGRIASLLEVGTGFHPELTGRENIFLNGAILGMSKGEINAKLDEIIDFSGVEEFIDTPVKRYSSGMYVRLAFAVAAHLEPEILVLDEVLAVGDADFQKKCLGKMQEVSRQGRTVLFVSHNLPMIRKLCSKGILLRNGKIVATGSTEDVIQQYIEHSFEIVLCDLSEVTDREGHGGLVFEKLELLDDEFKELAAAQSGIPLVVRLYFNNTTGKKYNAARFSLLIKNSDHGLILLDTSLAKEDGITVSTHGFVDFYLKRLPLTTGTFGTTLFVEADGEVQDWIQNGPSFIVEGGNFFNTGRNCAPGHEGKQVLVEHSVKFSWEM